MKLLLLLVSLNVTISFSQNYQLLPDSCTFCLFTHSGGGNWWIDNAYYGLFPDSDTLVNGNSYMMTTQGGSLTPFAFRQSGNRLLGILHNDTNEYLIMDFDAQIGDTIDSLYSEGITYQAKVLLKDSILLNNGSYHRFIKLMGFLPQGGNTSYDEKWYLEWNERGLCVHDESGFYQRLGGVYFNVPDHFYSISVAYTAPQFCTTDPLYTPPPIVSCLSCSPHSNDLDELENVLFTLSPNPANGFVYLKFQEIGIKTVRLYNSSGSFIKQIKTSLDELKLNTKELNAGLYFIELENDHSISRRKFLKE